MLFGGKQISRPMAALGTCNLALYAGIGGLVSLMPVYLARLGADAAESGRFLALAYLALAAGTLLPGKLSRLPGTPSSPRPAPGGRSHVLAVCGLCMAPITWGMVTAGDVARSMLLMACLWLLAGIGISTTSILTAADRDGASRRFGVLQLSAGLGLLLGALVSGPMVDRWGFGSLFFVFGCGYLLIPLSAPHAGQPNPTPADSAAIERAKPGAVARQPAFVILLIASVLAQAANISLFLSRALLMDRLGYDATAISTASAFGSALTLPLPVCLGWLSERLGRRPLIVACFAAPVLGLLLQASAVATWQFWLGSALSTVVGASLVVCAALVTDWFPVSAVGMPLALLNATPWVGIVLGLLSGGAAMERLLIQPALMLATLPGVVAVVLVLLVPTSPSAPAVSRAERALRFRC